LFEPSFSYRFSESGFGSIQNAQIYILYVKLLHLEYENVTFVSETVVDFKVELERKFLPAA
jgi:hypothetical protein